MSGALVLLLRLAVIIAGYAVAALAASAFLNLVLIGPLGWLPEEVPWVVMGSIVFTVPLVALFAAYFAFVPAVVVVLAAELLGRRDWLFYAIAGAMIAAVVVGFLWQASWPISDSVDTGELAVPIDRVVSDPGSVLAVIGSGIVGGFAYWFVAGRWAGNRSDRANPPTSPGPSGS